MPSLFIVGGTGQIGRAAALEFIATGWRVTIGHRGSVPLPEALKQAGVEEAIFDRDQPGALARAAGRGADALLDCVAFTPEHGRQLVEVSPSLGAIVAISSASVYRDEDGRTLDEARQTGFPDFPAPIRESQPTVDPGPETYSTNKVALERVLLEDSTASVTILRPGAVHGPGSLHPREWWFLKRGLDGRERVPVSYGGESLFHTTAAANIARACLVCAEGRGSHLLNVGDPDPLTVANIGRAIGRTLERACEVVGFEGRPRGTVGATPWSIPKPIVIDTKALEALGYAPATDYQRAIGETCADLRQAAERAGDWRRAFPMLASYPYEQFDYAAEDAFLGAAAT